MTFHSFFYSFIHACLLTALVVSTINLGFAEVRSSSNYRVQSDSLNVGGGYSTSSAYAQESTVGEIATGRSTSSSFALRAGYQQLQAVSLSLVPPADVLMDGSIPGLTGGTANGSTTFTVITDSPSGYQVTITSAEAPAMNRTTGSETIADYSAGATPDYSFSFGASDALFGYTVEGADVSAAFLDNGGLCGVGTQENADACWRGLSTGEETIVSAPGSNHPSGVSSTLKFRVGLGSDAGVVAGTYVATTTITALPL